MLTLWFPFAFELFALKLATTVNSPARDSKRNMEPWNTTLVTPGYPDLLRVGTFRAPIVYKYLISSSFNAPFGGLFIVPSPYYCAIGLELYLALEVNVSQFHTPVPRRTTPETDTFLSTYA